MVAAAAEFISRLHREGRINGIISAGGLQNTVLATSAMRRLPIGIPKVMVTTAATGPREFQLVTGNRDIIVVPSLSDLAGVNMFTRTTLDNACACLAGMLTLTEHPGEGIRRGSRRPVGLTQMGATNTAAVAAIARLRELGFEPVGFHATGSGGPTMEECVGDGLLHGALDMTLHEIVSDVMGTGTRSARRAAWNGSWPVTRRCSWPGADWTSSTTGPTPSRVVWRGAGSSCTTATPRTSS